MTRIAAYFVLALSINLAIAAVGIAKKWEAEPVFLLMAASSIILIGVALWQYLARINEHH